MESFLVKLQVMYYGGISRFYECDAFSDCEGNT